MQQRPLARLQAIPAFRAVLDALGAREDVWLVGGAVRDALIGRTPRDVDLVVTGDPLALAAQLGEPCAAHDRFGTVTALAGGLAVNVAMARRERYPRPGALPEVEPAALEDDLGRRDFTVNAIAVDLAGELHAAPGALDDLAAGLLRVLHAGSFRDDPTRLWRLARYASRLGFAIEPQTDRLAGEAVAAGALDTVSPPRLGAEVRLALEEPDPVGCLATAAGLGLLAAAPPPQTTAAALELLGGAGHAGLLALGAAGVSREWLDAIGMPARERETILGCADAPSLAARLAGAARPSQVAAVARGRALEAVALAGALGARDAARAWLDELRHVRLEIGGADLLAAGVPEGPELGERLERALAARLDGEAVGREAELAVALA